MQLFASTDLPVVPVNLGRNRWCSQQLDVFLLWCLLLVTGASCMYHLLDMGALSGSTCMYHLLEMDVSFLLAQVVCLGPVGVCMLKGAFLK
jgi:hypothetical protein